jgi:L-rhamnose-H+ transport protein
MAFFSFGTDAGKQMWDVEGEIAISNNYNFVSNGRYLSENSIIFLVISWGGLITNILWSTPMVVKNKSGFDFINL